MVEPRRKYRESKEDFIKRASQIYYSNGYHLTEIASKLKCDILDVYTATIKGKYRTVTSDERDLMISMYCQGYSYSKIAKELGRSRACVQTRIKTAPKCYVESGYTLSDKDLEKMKKWYDEGKTMKWIANQLKISEGSIRHRLIKAGIHEKDHSLKIPLSNKDKIIIKKMYKMGKTIKEIADNIGRHHNMISKYITKNFK